MIRDNLISYGNLRGLSYDGQNFGGKIGTSDCNEYVPFYTIMNHILLDIEGHRIIEYGKPNYNYTGFYARTYRDLFSDLKNINHTKTYNFTLQGEPHQFGYTRHTIYSTDNKLLCCLAIKSSALLNNSFAQLQANQNPEDFIFLVDNTLFSNPIYKNIAKKVDSNYISLFKESDIDLVYTNDIDKWLFKNNLSKPTFKNVPEMMKHLKTEVPKILVMN